MSGYQRPSFLDEIYLDGNGEPIAYGHRWGKGSPAEDSYSVTSNLHRFAPLHDVADALIAWLDSTFDVVAEESLDFAADLIHQPAPATRAVRVIPHNPAAAPLTFVFTQFPGVAIHAGVLHDFHFPSCGCDACDEGFDSVAEELEWTVRTVVSGGYSETFDRWPGKWLEYKLYEEEVGMRSGRGRIGGLPAERVKLARTSLPNEGHWLPWTTKIIERTQP
ncbi:DUF6226 family protein [Arthrobacter psychrolactophilus]